MINKKGQLFGKINIIDLLICAVILSVIVFILGAKNNDEANVTVTPSNKKEIYIVAEAYNLNEEIAKSFIEGDKIVAQNRYQEGTIDQVTITEANYVGTTIDGDLVAQSSPLFKNIEVGISCTVNVNGPYMDIGGQEIKIGNSYWIKTDKAQVAGVIKEIGVN